MSAINLIITDETFTGQAVAEVSISLDSAEVSVGHIIACRVRTEVLKYNNKKPAYFNGLVQPSEAEQALNGYKLKRGRQIDAEKQVKIALKAFEENGFFMFVDGQQAESLEQKLNITSITQVSFIKLTPLVGG